MAAPAGELSYGAEAPRAVMAQRLSRPTGYKPATKRTSSGTIRSCASSWR